jgi:hypothetical protein
MKLKEPVFNDWDKYINSYKESAPKTMKSVA